MFQFSYGSWRYFAQIFVYKTFRLVRPSPFQEDQITNVVSARWTRIIIFFKADKRSQHVLSLLSDRLRFYRDERRVRVIYGTRRYWGPSAGAASASEEISGMKNPPPV
jgi:hypothetical protein